MIVYATSDLHGNLPEPPADAELLLIAGDICPDFTPHGADKAAGYVVDKGGIRQSKWLENQFVPWLVEHGVLTYFVWGNHDFVGEKSFLVPNDAHRHLIHDESVELADLRIWGTPWVPGLPYWAFYGCEEVLQRRSDLIPEGLDVLMTHGPPFGFGDLVPYTPKYARKYNVPPEGENVGDPTLLYAIARAKPKVTICGHIHEARGAYEFEGNPIYNVTAVDENYVLHKNPWTRLYELD